MNERSKEEHQEHPTGRLLSDKQKEKTAAATDFVIKGVTENDRLTTAKRLELTDFPEEMEIERIDISFKIDGARICITRNRYDVHNAAWKPVVDSSGIRKLTTTFVDNQLQERDGRTEIKDTGLSFDTNLEELRVGSLTVRFSPQE